MHLILLSGENLKLARLEAESLLNLENTNLVGNMLYCTIPTSKMEIINRLAYVKKVYEVMYITARKNLESSLESYPWINVYEKDFCIRITSEEHYDERHYSNFVWSSLERSTRPKVNLNNSKLVIEIFIRKDNATVTRLIYHNFETFENRKAHLRPVLHPTAMHPKMARALINILNPSPNEKVIDPFCGACGILTEAGMLGIKFQGYDIDKKILADAFKNLEYFDIDSKKYDLTVKDATKITGLKNVVTDLPYGKSSKKSEELIDIYSKFIKNISGRAVIVMPNFMPYNNILKKNLSKSLIVIDIIDHYIHKSLTRKIILIDKNSTINPRKKLVKKVSKNKISKVKNNKITKHKTTKKRIHNIKKVHTKINIHKKTLTNKPNIKKLSRTTSKKIKKQKK